MAHKIYEEYLKFDIDILLAEAAVAQLADHPGMTGAIREYGIGKFLAKYLPGNWDFGKGKIIDSEGNTSSEIDLVIYNKTNLAPRLYKDVEGIFPIECVLYAFEIKSTSDNSKLSRSIKNFHELKTLKSTHVPFGGIRCVYFAYNTDLSMKSELERYMELDEKYYWNPAFNVICVMNQGYWVYYNKEVDKERKKWLSEWHKFTLTENKYHIKGLLIGILNTIAAENSKFSAAPSLSSYLVAEDSNSVIKFKKEYSFP